MESHKQEITPMRKDFKHTTECNGTQLTAEVSPCVWMYPAYPLQIRINMAGGGNAFKVHKGLTWGTATEEDVVALAESVSVCACSRCGKPAFDPATVETNRGGLCESCFMADLTATYQKEVEKEMQAVRAEDDKMRADGFTHKVEAWIHPAQGDDYQIDFYVTSRPLDDTIVAMLARRGSAVPSDYVIKVL
jgi:hypothetical protein